jgi:hypothetical protein
MPMEEAQREVEHFCKQLRGRRLDPKHTDGVLALLYDMISVLDVEEEEANALVLRTLQHEGIVHLLALVAQQCCFLAACTIICVLSDRLQVQIKQQDVAHLVDTERTYTEQQVEVLMRVLLRVTDWDESHGYYTRIMAFCDQQRGVLLESLACAVQACVHGVAAFVHNPRFEGRVIVALSVLDMYDEQLAHVRLRPHLVQHLQMA